MKHFDEIERMLLEIFHGTAQCRLEEDSEGQLIVYTDWIPAREEHCGSLMEGWYLPREEMNETP